MRKLKIEISEKFQKIFEDLKEKVRGGNSAPEQAEAAVPYPYDDIESEIDEISDELGDEFIIYAEGGLAQRLRERLEKLIEDIKNKFDNGGSVDGNLMKKAEDFYDRLKKFGLEISEKFQKMWEDLKEKVRGGNSAPEQADFFNYKEMLRKLRERLSGDFDVEKIRDYIENMFGKSEMANQLLQIIQDKGGKARESIVKFINRILGEDTQAAEFSPQRAFNIKDLLTKLRERLQDDIDVEKIREHVENIVGKSMITDQLLEIIKEKGGKARQRILDFIDRFLGDKETQAAEFSAEHSIASRIKERLENLINRMKKNADDGKGVRGDLMKKASDVYEKFKNLGFELNQKFKQIFEDLRSKFQRSGPVAHAEHSIASRLKERLENLINRMKKDMDEGKGVRGDLMKKATDVYEKFRNLGFELNEKIKQVFEDMRSKFQRSGSVENAEFNVRENLKKLREMVKDNVNADYLKAMVEHLYGKGSVVAEQVIDILEECFRKGENYQSKLSAWIDRVFGKEEERRFTKEIYEKVRKYFKDLNMEWKERRFVNFGEYVKEQYQRVLDQSKSNVENIKKIAREFLDDSKNLSKDLAGEALEYFREYKNDLGKLWEDVQEKVRHIIKKD